MLKEKVAETTGCQDETKKKRDILCIYHKQETSKKNVCDLFKESKFPWFTENYSAALKQVKSISILENFEARVEFRDFRDGITSVGSYVILISIVEQRKMLLICYERATKWLLLSIGPK